MTKKRSPSKVRLDLQRERLKGQISHPYITGQKLQPGVDPPAKPEAAKGKEPADDASDAGSGACDKK